MEDKGDHDELKEPIRSLSREITQKYVQELVREAIKQAMKSKTRDLKEKQILKLEKQIKEKSDNERLEQFKKPAEEISRSIREGSIEGNKALGQMSKILESSIKPPLPLILKALFILVVVGAPLLLFFIFMPSLSVAPENLDLAEGVSESAQLKISNSGGGVLLWTASSDQPWITLSPERGANEGNVIVLVDAEDMKEGTYEGTVTIDSLAGTEQCPIRLVVGSQPPILAVDPLSIDFELKEGESGEEELRISNDGGDDLEWEVSADEQWITLSPESGINSGTVTVTVDTADLSPEEEYEGTITIESNGENEECIIYLRVLPEGKGKEKPILAVDPDPLSFNFTLAEGESDSKEFYISNEGGDELEWNIVPDTDWPSWIYVDPISGMNSETITIEVDAADLTSGNYNTTFRVESNEEYKEGVVSLKVSGEDEGPDLVVTSLEIVGDATRVVEGDSAYIAVPISVVVSNQGDQAADIFKVSTEYTSSSGTYTVAFRVPGESNIWYPYTDELLDPGEEFTFEGEVLFSDSLSDETVYLKAIADSCSGDEFKPAYCRVEESNEDNNESPEVEVYLPAIEFEGPDLVVTSLDVTGDATVTDVRRNPDGSLFKYYIAVPLHVAIKNQGDEAAGVFNVSIEVLEETDVTGLHYRFIVPGKNNYLDPSTDAPLNPGEETAFDGEVLIHNMSSGKTVFIKAIADSCPLSDYYCVSESNEENNELTVEVDLPYLEVNNIPIVEIITFSVE